MRQRTPAGPGDERLATPRAAGVAGIVFALLLGTAIVLLRTALPAGAASGDVQLDADAQRAVSWAIQLVPFAGIAFLWFMGALREHTGEAEDRFFATAFLGSGLVFVAAMFAAAAAAGTVLESDRSSEFGRLYAHTLLMTYSMRMAAVFVFVTSTMGRRMGVLPRPVTALGFAAGLVLLFVGAAAPWSELVFPAWALVVSVTVLRAAGGRRT
ncbi:hypothetical protein [Streptomyces sp. NPDC012888]|uniref:hypothetical protein n=1 Tax=Streptomyces sp. NPDC012888 TaxID=3364855 RepID=UPI0036BD6810